MIAVASTTYRRINANFVVTAINILPTRQAATPPRLSDEDERFAYEVIAGSLQRSLDRSRFIATLLVGLFAAQSATHIFLIDKHTELTSPEALQRLDIGLVCAIVGAALSLFLRESPRPRTFKRAFRLAPHVIRSTVMDEAVNRTLFNEILGLGQALLFAASLALSAWGTLAINLGKAVK